MSTMTIYWNLDERKMVRSLLRIQIESLRKLLEEDDELVLERCEEDDLCEEEMRGMVKKNLSKFLMVFNTPEKIGKLDKDQISIFRHILNNYYECEEFREIKSSIWKKMFIWEKITLN